jgi:hypothetical protein
MECSKIFIKVLDKAKQVQSIIIDLLKIKNLVLAGTCLVCCSYFFCSKAFIYDIRVLRKWDEPNKRYSYFIGLGDFHDKSHSVTNLQIKQIDDIIARCKKDRTKLIVEDVCSAPTTGKKICDKFCINSTGGILGGIAKKYENSVFCNNFGRLNNIDNIEYRFCRVASLAPVINDLNSDYKKFISTSSISVGCFKNEIMNTISELKGYNDCDSLKKWYQNSINSVIGYMGLLKFDKYLTANIADYITMNSNKQNRLNFVKKLLIFDSCLLDAKIVHSIIGANAFSTNSFDSNNNLTQNFIVVAGGSHIRNVSSVLESIGYKPVYKSNVLVNKEAAKENCPTSNIMSDGVCCKPEPVDLKVLERFI